MRMLKPFSRLFRRRASKNETEDQAKAVDRLRIAAEQGDAVAQFSLGEKYGKGEGVLQDHAEAERWYRQAADQGFPMAQFMLARMYEKGQGLPQDTFEAVAWYHQAAEQGLVLAQYALGDIYRVGEGDDFDYGGDEDSGEVSDIHLGVPQDYAEAMRWYRKAAEQGFALAQSAVGSMYARGEGVPQDGSEAMRWYRKAAEQGSGSAQYALAKMHRRRAGYAPVQVAAKDYTEAMKWYRHAAEQGDAMAQQDLATMYQTGQGVPQDYVEAYKWRVLAVSSYAALSENEEVNVMALKARDRTAMKMTPAQIAKGRRLARAWNCWIPARPI